jgi:hypothetical protein
VLRDLTDHRLAVAIGHPIPRLDPSIVGDRPIEVLLELDRRHSHIS